MTASTALRQRSVRVFLAIGLAATVLAATVFAGCGSNGKDAAADNSVTASDSSASDQGADDSAAAATPAAGKIGCPALKETIVAMFVNWQLVIGLARTPDVKLWANLPIGTLPEFASQLDTLYRQLGSYDRALESIDFMKGANDIVQKGLGGDSAAPGELATYVGTDVVKAISKQNSIAEAGSKVGC